MRRCVFVMLFVSATLGGCGDSEPAPITPTPEPDTTEAADETTPPVDGEDSPDVAPDEGEPADGELPVDIKDAGVEDVYTGPPPETGPGLGIDWDNEATFATPRYEPGAADWLAVGWPTNALLGEDGRPDLSAFQSEGNDLLATYIDLGEKTLDGFGANGSVYFELDASVDLGALPRPAESMAPLSVVQLVNATPTSSRYGERVPLVFRQYTTGDDPYYHPNTLAMRPISGFPLSGGDTWCAVLTRGVTGPNGGYLAPAPGFPEAVHIEPTLAPFSAWMTDSDLRTEDVAVATCFTVHDPTAELRKVRAFLDTQDVPAVATVSEPRLFGELHGTYLAPNFQAGEKPYEQDGDLRFDDDGNPIVQLDEEIRFMIMVPRHMPVPEAGWPVVLYGHGTGGSYLSCRSSGRQLNDIGIAVICIDQPLHQFRGPVGKKLDDLELVLFSFNFGNPWAGRMSFRQSAIDVMTLARMVDGGSFSLGADATQTGMPLHFDPEQIYFFGHSHGGLSGALLLGVEPLIAGGVLSGTGGGLIHTILLRKDPADLKLLVTSLMNVPLDDFDKFHPAMSLIQMMVDATDPINYSPLWLHPKDGGTPKHVLVTEGTADHATPGIATDTMLAAAGAPLIGPIAKSSPAHELMGMAIESAPLSLNILTDAGPRTAGFQQWQDGTHWVAFDNDEARASWRWFFDTLVNGDAATIGTGDLGFTKGGEVSAGDVCETAGVIDVSQLPVDVVGNTNLAGDDYASGGACAVAGAGRRDVVFQLTADEHAVYNFDLAVRPKEDKKDPPTGPNRMYVVTDCADTAASCLGLVGNGDMSLELDAGQTVWIVIDGTGTSYKGPFTVRVAKGCAFESCGDKQCGSAGCTDCGACDAGMVCSDTGACEAPAAGDVCASAKTLETLPAVVTGSTVGASADYYFDTGWCPGFDAKYGQASSDVVYQFTATSSDTWVVRLESDYDASLHVTTECGNAAETCLGAQRKSNAGEQLELELEKGQTAFVVVDGAGNTTNHAGLYTLHVGTCVPECEGKPCGPDGCGGSCGQCDDDSRCVTQAGCEPIPYVCAPTAVCEVIANGDTCALALPINEAPFEAEGTTSGLYNDYGFGTGSCPGESKGWGGSSNDTVYVYTPSETAIYTVDLDANYDASLYVTTDCADVGGGCLAGKNVEKKGNESFHVTLEGGVAHFIVVDGAFSSSHAGSYTLALEVCTPDCTDAACGSDGCGGSCGSCAATQACSSGQCGIKDGDSCEDTILVGSKYPWKKTQNHDGFTAAHDSVCGEEALSNEVVYRFKPKSNGTYRFEVNSGFDGQLHVTESCDDLTECLGSGKSLDLKLSNGQQTYIIVEGTGSSTLTVSKLCFPNCTDKVCGSDGCGGNCGSCPVPTDVCTPEKTCMDPATVEGDSCQTPFEVGTLPYFTSNQTLLAEDFYRFGDGECPGWVGKGGASPEHVYRLVAPQAGDYRIELLPSGFDAVLYVVDSCDDIASSCLATSDSRSAEALELTLEAAQEVFVMVDGASNEIAEFGLYSLSIVGLE